MKHFVGSATETHIEQIFSIWEAGWHEAHAEIVPPSLRDLRTRASFKERALQNVADTYVAVGDDVVLGFCMVKENEVYQMYVSQHARGLGVAQSLMSEAESRIHSNGHHTAWLACAVGNERAARFYEKSGWVNAGKQVVDLDTSAGTFPLEVWRFEKSL
ncbi:GNAT family N-acetyltransferase [Cognatiyoonia sp. IB215182]|uniref:GNAT family N-acetyltransferase n=1 Tax=Cognatiyoonia sp. IB215182 TaxID=3097353 RepID=UPI002A0CE756|nr:GNAT family N-acetyltransferase [Cognatiyoonia sp. IB215182]MDX8354320.1 GNAT family N-acetyltransferase [Cognatiyoonia sp. IB215182]